MVIILDAYNLLKRTLGKRFITEIERQRLITRLESYARLQEHTLLIVFDGGESVWPYTQVYSPHVTLMFSGERSSADTLIKKLITSAQSNNTILVTADNELARHSHKRQIITVDPTDFVNFITNTISTLQHQKTEQSRQKTSVPYQQSNQELDRLMEEGSHRILYKKEDLLESPKSTDIFITKKPSKQEKKLTRLIKKL